MADRRPRFYEWNMVEPTQGFGSDGHQARRLRADRQHRHGDAVTRFAWGAASDTGRVRQANEDSFLVVDGLFAVADGMGGHQAGEVASHLALESLQSGFTAAGTDVLVRSVEDANRILVERSTADPELAGMGTTLVAMALVEASGRDAIGVVNVGDSRLYLLSDGNLAQITEDHSLVATMERQGRLTAAEAAVHPQRNILTRALGIDGTVLVDSWEILPVIGDRYLICSDGLFNEVDESRIAATLRRLADPNEASRELIRLANEGGGRDNITCVIVDVVDDAGRDPKADPANRVRNSHTGGDLTVPEPPEAELKAPRAPGAIRSSFTWRVGVFIAAFVFVILAGFAFIWWTGTKTWYVGVDGDKVAIFHGKPGGVLWIEPTLAEDSELLIANVPRSAVVDVQNGVEQPSLELARAYIDNLVEQNLKASTTTTLAPLSGSSTSSITTTTVR
ncbi:MAG: Stp1/IreP family PP2C-type Ser/Thr phosphatase [Actinobacteria bacterium]|nr:Stp1/IreP family PP2C-type Ser/Thr phosphatase [Actinomycetota bacterium]